MARPIPFHSLGEFIRYLDSQGQTRRIGEPVSLALEMTALHQRVLRAGGPALVFDQAIHASGQRAAMPVVTNVFGTAERVAWGLGSDPAGLDALGQRLADLRMPRPPGSLHDLLARWPLAKAALHAQARRVGSPPVQQRVYRGPEMDLGLLPVQQCWPGEPAPLINFGMVITRPPDADPADSSRYNAGIYRMQLLGRDRLIMRWLMMRGGAAHHRAWAARGEAMPCAVAIGADPASLLAAALPLPEDISELNFAGLLRGARTRLARAVSQPLLVPAEAEIVIEGTVAPDETAPEGPYGDHTGYYNAVENFPVLRASAMTTRADPYYLTTHTGRPPDEPSVIGAVFNELARPLIRQSLPEVQDVWFPPEACSYRVAVVAIRKSYAGQARRVMMGLWGLLPQFTMTKVIIVVDDDINPRHWDDVLWALSTRMDPVRDSLMVPATAIDTLDFAAEKPGLGGKMGLDATVKTGSETSRDWPAVLSLPHEVTRKAAALCARLGLAGKD